MISGDPSDLSINVPNRLAFGPSKKLLYFWKNAADKRRCSPVSCLGPLS